MTRDDDVLGRRDRRGPIAWMAMNPVTANLLMVALLLGGVLTFLNIKQEVFPEFEIDRVDISVAYPGASPEEVEKGIILVIEEGVRGVDGVDEVTSTAAEGGGRVSCELLLGADRQRVYQDIKQEVDRITTLPEDAEEPQVNLATHRHGVVTLVLYGDETEKRLRDLAEQIREELLQDKDITQVDLEGIRDLEITALIANDTLRAYGLTVSDVAGAIDRASVERPAGGVKTDGGEVLLRIRDRRDWGREFENIPILGTTVGRQVRLGELATVRDDFEDTDQFATYNGKQAVLIEVYRIGKQKPLTVAAAAKQMIADLNAKLPAGVRIEVLNDRSDIYRQRAALLTKNGLIGLTLVLALLGAFLDARLAFWVAMGIPISFLGGLILMPALGVTINMISMFAFLIALGIVVDDAIVVGENVYEYHQRGMPFLKAAVIGTREVTMPVVFSVLTNIVAFFPLFWVPGTIGKIWKVIPAVVITVFAISLVECIFILPAHLGHSRRRVRRGLGRWFYERQQRFGAWFLKTVRTVYGPFLDRVLAHRYITCALATCVLIVTIGYIKSGRIGMVPMPRVDADYSIVTAVLPYGSPVQQTRKVRDHLIRTVQALGEEITREDPRHRGQIKGVYAEIGRSFRGVSGGHVVEVRTYLTGPDERPVFTREFTEMWRKKAGAIAGLDALQFQSDRGGPGGGASLSLQLSHGNSAELEAACRETTAWLDNFPNVSDVDPGFSAGKTQIDFTILPAGLSLGLTSEDVARQARNAFYGAEALRQQRGRNEIKVRVRLADGERNSEEDISGLLIRTPAGTYVPLSEIAQSARGRSYTSIDRRNGRRVLTVTANVTPYDASERMLKAYIDEKFPELSERHPGLGYGFAGRQEDLREGLAALRTGFIIAILVIYVCLAVPFRSYSQPLIIMTSIPFGIVGAVIGHLIMGYSLSMISMMGVIALSGVVVNDSLVLIDFANRRKQEGMDAHDAMLNAGVRRFRPVMLTTLTTFGGLAPMIFEQSRQARFMIPMALSLGYGILFATAITLIIVPSLYMIIEDAQKLFQRSHTA